MKCKELFLQWKILCALFICFLISVYSQEVKVENDPRRYFAQKMRQMQKSNLKAQENFAKEEQTNKNESSTAIDNDNRKRSDNLSAFVSREIYSKESMKMDKLFRKKFQGGNFPAKEDEDIQNESSDMRKRTESRVEGDSEDDEYTPKSEMTLKRITKQTEKILSNVCSSSPGIVRSLDQIHEEMKGLKEQLRQIDANLSSRQRLISSYTYLVNKINLGMGELIRIRELIEMLKSSNCEQINGIIHKLEKVASLPLSLIENIQKRVKNENLKLGIFVIA